MNTLLLLILLSGPFRLGGGNNESWHNGSHCKVLTNTTQKSDLHVRLFLFLRKSLTIAANKSLLSPLCLNFLFSLWLLSSLIPLSQQQTQTRLNELLDKNLDEKTNWSFHPTSSLLLKTVKITFLNYNPIWREKKEKEVGYCSEVVAEEGSTHFVQ